MVSKTILEKMTSLENREIGNAPLGYKVLGYDGLKVKFGKVNKGKETSRICKSHTGKGAAEVLPSIPASEFT